MKKLGSEFKQFIMRGNVVDLAVGVVIGGAFGKIVTALVDNIIMPLVGILIGGMNFSDLSVVIGGTEEAPVLLQYGAFIQSVIDFLIIALCIFIFVKAINKLFKKKEEQAEEAEEEAPAEKPEDIKLLEEIRDLLADKAEK